MTSAVSQLSGNFQYILADIIESTKTPPEKHESHHLQVSNVHIDWRLCSYFGLCKT